MEAEENVRRWTVPLCHLTSKPRFEWNGEPSVKDDQLTPETDEEQLVDEEQHDDAVPLSVQLPLEDDSIATLRAGEWVLLSGPMISIGHEAGLHLLELLEQGEPSPVPLENTTIYFATPGHAPIGAVLGSMAPQYTNDFEALIIHLLDRGARCLIGRGPLSEEVVQRIKRKRGVYLVSVGGAGALLSRTVYQAQVTALEELGREAIRSIKVEQFPAVVAMDGFGRNILQHHSSPPNLDDEDNEELV